LYNRPASNQIRFLPDPITELEQALTRPASKSTQTSLTQSELHLNRTGI